MPHDPQSPADLPADLPLAPAPQAATAAADPPPDAPVSDERVGDEPVADAPIGVPLDEPLVADALGADRPVADQPFADETVAETPLEDVLSAHAPLPEPPFEDDALAGTAVADALSGDSTVAGETVAETPEADTLSGDSTVAGETVAETPEADALSGERVVAGETIAGTRVDEAPRAETTLADVAVAETPGEEALSVHEPAAEPLVAEPQIGEMPVDAEASAPEPVSSDAAPVLADAPEAEQPASAAHEADNGAAGVLSESAPSVDEAGADVTLPFVEETTLPLHPTPAPRVDAKRSPARRTWNTPVATAAPEIPRQAGPVTFSVEGGTYAPPVTISLSAEGDDAEIRYTEDGSEPSADSPLYTRGDPLFLGKSTTVAARAFRAGAEPGPVTTHHYEMRSPQWKVLEPEDQTDGVEHQIQDERLEFTSGWSLAAASVRGRLHAHRGAWREDSYEFATKGAWSILAVSDGAGSAALSRVGSRVACSRAVDYMRGELPDAPPAEMDDEALKTAFLPALRAHLANAAHAALGGLRVAAAERRQPVDAFAATLILVVSCPWGERHLVGCLQVGDGQFALLTDRDGPECKLLGDADHGAHSSETRFLTTRGVEETLEHRVKFTAPERLVAMALMTDGVSDDFFPEEKRMIDLFVGHALPGMTGRDGGAVEGVLSSVVPSDTPGEALREWIEYERKGSSDDRTLLLTWLRR